MMKKILSWAIIFGALSATTYYSLSSGDELKTSLAHAAETNQSAVLLSLEERHEENAIKRIANRINRQNLVCTVNAEQAGFLAGNYDTETETVTINGEEVDILKIERETPSNLGEVRRYLRETSESNCIVIPARNWFYVVAGVGAVSEQQACILLRAALCRSWSLRGAVRA